MERPLLLILLTIWINSLSVLVLDRSSPSYFLMKLFEFGPYANSLDHLDCILAVFYNKFCISESKFLCPSMKAVVRTCACAISLDHLDFRLFMFGHIATRNQDEFTLSFISRQKFIFLFFEEAVRIWSLSEFSWPFGFQIVYVWLM